MNDLLIAIIPFVACFLLFVAWVGQNRKATPVRIAEPVRRKVDNNLVEADRSGVQVPA